MMMRRLAQLLVLLAPATAFAQAPPPPGQAPVGPVVQKPTRVGIKLGLNAAILENDVDPSGAVELLDSEALMTFAVGGMIIHRVAPNMSVMAELMYIQKGSSFDGSGLGVGDIKSKLSYIEAPLLGRYELSPGAQLQPFVYAGGAAALYLSGVVELDGETQDIDDENVSTIDLGLVVGAGAEMAAGTTTLIFDLRYTHGLIDLDTTDPDETGGGDFSTKSRVISLFGGIVF